MLRDNSQKSLLKQSIAPVSVANNAAQVGQIIDGAGFETLDYLVAVGAIGTSAATFAVLLEEGDAANLSDAATVTDADMVSETPGTAPLTAAGFAYANANQIRRVSYIGAKRYTRLTITPANNSAAAIFGAVALLGAPHIAPVTQTAS